MAKQSVMPSVIKSLAPCCIDSKIGRLYNLIDDPHILLNLGMWKSGLSFPKYRLMLRFGCEVKRIKLPSGVKDFCDYYLKTTKD